MEEENVVEKYIDQFLSWLSLEKGRQPSTVKSYAYELKRFSDFIAQKGIHVPHEVKKQDIRAFLASLARTNDKTSRARSLSCIRSFFEYLVREDILHASPAAGIDTPSIERKIPHCLTERQYLHLLEIVREYATPSCLRRDLAIVGLFLATGIRRAELVALDLADLDLERGYIKVRRKGGKEQLIELNKDIQGILSEYKEARGNDPGPLFLSKRRKRITGSAVYALVKKYLFFAELEGSVHTLRHTCFTQMARRGVSLPVIRDIAGHSQIETTSYYAHSLEEDRRKAVQTIRLMEEGRAAD